MNEKWDRRFLHLAHHVAGWSRDPSTKCGAVIVRPDKTIAAVGFNGFPRGMKDDEALYADREVKYDRVIHGEINAILNAGGPVRGCTLYVAPFFTCSRCAVHVIQAGIKRVVSPALSGAVMERWGESIHRAMAYYREAEVSYSIMKDTAEIVEFIPRSKPTEVIL